MKEIIEPPGMWNATARSYSHVVKFTNPQALIFVAGQAAVGPNLEVIAPNDIEGQARVTFEHIRDALAAAGASLDDVVDMTVYVTDIVAHQWPVRKVREEFFGTSNLPVSTMIEVSRLALDGLVLEVDVIAAL